MADLQTAIKGLRLAHPVLPWPGAQVSGAAAAAEAVRGGAAALVLQTVTTEPEPYADPLWAPQGKDGAFHRLPCSPVPFDAWLETEFKAALAMARAAGVPCIATIGYGHDPVVRMGRRLAAAGADALIYDTAHAERWEIGPALASLKALVDIPILLTLAPHHGEDLSELAGRLEPFADGFIMIGAFGPVLSLDAEAPDRSAGLGFISGASIRPVMQRFVFETAKRVRKPVIAAGGIETGAGAAEALMLGATAVMVGTSAALRGPAVYGKIANELDSWLSAHGYTQTGDIQRAYVQKYGNGQRVVTEKEETPALLSEACIKCTFCETVCFYDAIAAPAKTLPRLTAEPCFQCGLCVSACPTGALQFAPRDAVTMLAEGV